MSNTIRNVVTISALSLAASICQAGWVDDLNSQFSGPPAASPAPIWQPSPVPVTPLYSNPVGGQDLRNAPLTRAYIAKQDRQNAETLDLWKSWNITPAPDDFRGPTIPIADKYSRPTYSVNPKQSYSSCPYGQRLGVNNMCFVTSTTMPHSNAYTRYPNKSR